MDSPPIYTPLVTVDPQYFLNNGDNGLLSIDDNSEGVIQTSNHNTQSNVSVIASHGNQGLINLSPQPTSGHSSSNEDSSGSGRESVNWVRKPKFELPKSYAKYYTYLGHDMKGVKKDGKPRATNKRPFKVRCKKCGRIVNGHDSEVRKSLCSHLKTCQHILSKVVKRPSTSDNDSPPTLSISQGTSDVELIQMKLPRKHILQHNYELGLMRFLVSAGCAFNVLNNSYLENLFLSFNNGLRVMKGWTVRRRLRAYTREQVYPFLKWLSNDISDAGLILDGWSSRALECVLVLKIVYMTGMMERKIKTVGVLHLTGKHTAERIREKVISHLTLFDLPNKIRYVITDSASNMKKAFSSALGPARNRLNYSQHFCLAHKLNLVVMSSIKNVTTIRTFIDRLVAQINYLRRSPLLYTEFLALSSNRHLIRPVITRWGAYKSALERFLEPRIFASVRSVLMMACSNSSNYRGEPPLPFTDVDSTVLNVMLKLLSPLSHASLILEADKFETCEAIPLVTEAYQLIGSVDVSGYSFLLEFRTCLQERLVHYMKDELCKNNLIFQTILNPTMQHEFFDAHVQEFPNNPFGLPTSDEALNKFYSVYPATNVLPNPSPPPASTTRTYRRKLSVRLASKLGEQRQEAGVCAYTEYSRYSLENKVFTDEEQDDPNFVANFWRANSTRYPEMFKAALVEFVHVTSSASAERSFSKFGNWQTYIRNRMKISCLCDLALFLENMDLTSLSTDPDVQRYISDNDHLLLDGTQDFEYTEQTFQTPAEEGDDSDEDIMEDNDGVLFDFNDDDDYYDDVFPIVFGCDAINRVCIE